MSPLCSGQRDKVSRAYMLCIIIEREKEIKRSSVPLNKGWIDSSSPFVERVMLSSEEIQRSSVPLNKGWIDNSSLLSRELCFRQIGEIAFHSSVVQRERRRPARFYEISIVFQRFPMDFLDFHKLFLGFPKFLWFSFVFLRFSWISIDFLSFS